jgi:hypothetical protein
MSGVLPRLSAGHWRIAGTVLSTLTLMIYLIKNQPHYKKTIYCYCAVFTLTTASLSCLARHAIRYNIGPPIPIFHISYLGFPSEPPM